MVRHKSAVSCESGQCVLARVIPLSEYVEDNQNTAAGPWLSLSLLRNSTPGENRKAKQVGAKRKQVFPEECFSRGATVASPGATVASPSVFRALYSVLRTSVCLTGQALLTALWRGDRLREPSSPADAAQESHTGPF